MSSDADEATDSDGTSGDTILRELCMLRCTSGIKGCKRVPSQDENQLDSTGFSTFCISDINASDPVNSRDLEPSWIKSDSPSVQPHISGKYTDFNVLSRSSSKCDLLQETCNFKGFDGNSQLSNPWFKYLHGIDPYTDGPPDSHVPTNFWSRHLRNESLTQLTELQTSGTRNLLSTGTETPQFDTCNCHCFKGAGRETQDSRFEKRSDKSQQVILEPDNEEPSSIEFLLRKRCSSPDCACDKQFSLPANFHRKRLYRRCSRPRSIGSQVTETVLGLTLSDWNGQIVIQEGDSVTNRKLEREAIGAVNSQGSCETVPGILRFCKVSSVSESSSDSGFTLLQKCSDCNLLSTLGFTRDKGHNNSRMSEYKGSYKEPRENKEIKNSKGQAPESYGKLLHKIDKLKKITSWKSKRRKNKLKVIEAAGGDMKEITDEISCMYNEEKESFINNEVQKQFETAADLSSGDHQSILLLPTEDSVIVNDFETDLLESKLDDSLKQSTKTCDIGVQSVESESFITTFESSLDCYAKKKPSREDVDIQTIETRVKKHNTYSSSTVNRGSSAKISGKSKRLKCESSTTFGSCCNFFHGEDPVLNWGGLETQGEILQHLKEINKLIERESCASNSTHRLYQNERSLGFEGNKSVSVKGNKKGVTEFTKSKKEGRIFWAVTKVTIYPDSCRTYEVMKLSRRKPPNVPSSSETVFVLLPNK